MRKLLLAAILSTAPGTVLAADPLVGTYIFDPARSKMSGIPETAQMKLVITEDGDNLVIDPTGKRVDGVPLTGTLVVPKAGGTRRPSNSEVGYDTQVVTRISDRALEAVRSSEGKERIRVRLELSPDGQTLTRTVNGVTPQGGQFQGVSVLVKQ